MTVPCAIKWVMGAWWILCNVFGDKTIFGSDFLLAFLIYTAFNALSTCSLSFLQASAPILGKEKAFGEIKRLLNSLLTECLVCSIDVNYILFMYTG